MAVRHVLYSTARKFSLISVVPNSDVVPMLAEFDKYTICNFAKSENFAEYQTVFS